MNARCAASSTICRSSHSSRTAVSTAAPRSGSDSTLTTCGNHAFRRSAHQQPARQVAVLVGAAPQPRPRARTSPQRGVLAHARVREAPRRAALAAHEQIGEVAGGALLVEPERPGRRAVATGAVHEPAPVDVVDVPPRAGADEPGGHDRAALETAVVVEGLPVHEPPRSDVPVAGVRLLDDEPLGKAPRADAHRRSAGVGRYRRRGHHPRHGDAGDGPQLPGEPRLVDRLELVRRRPLVEPRHDGRLVRQVDQGSGAVGRDDLAAAKLSVRSLLHDAPVGRGGRRSWRYRLTSGSTSRSERLARNFR